MIPSSKQLDASGIAKIEDMEKRSNCFIIALPKHASPAALSQAELAHLHSLEDELETILLAYTRLAPEVPELKPIEGLHAKERIARLSAL